MTLRYLITIFIILNFLISCGENTSPEQALIDADQAIENNEVTKAIIIIKGAIQNNIDNPNLRVALGNNYLRQGDLILAEKELNKAQTLGAIEDAWVLPLIQVNYLLNENIAIEHLWENNKQALNKSNFTKAQLYFALSLFSKKDKQAGFDELNAITNDIENNTTDSKPLALIVNKLMANDVSNDDILSSINELEDLAEENPNNWLAWLLLSKAQFSNSNFDKSAESYLHLAQLLPKFRIAQIYAAESNIEAKNYTVADKQLNKLLLSYPSNPYINQLFAKNSLIMKDFEQAKTAIEKTIASNYSDDTTKLLAGIIYYQLGEFENSFSYLAAIIERLPPKHPARNVFIANQIKLGNLEYAYSELNKTETLASDAELISAAAQSLLATNQNQHAADLLNKINIEQAPTPTLALKLSRLKYMAGDESALDGLEETIRNITSEDTTAPGSIQEARTMELAVLFQNERLDEAVDRAEKWINDEPENIGNYLLLIEVMKRVKDVEKIGYLYEKILTIDANFISAKLYFSAKYLSQKKFKKAINLYDEILSVDSSNSKAIVGKYMILLELNKNKEAESFIQQKLNQADKSSALSLVLAKTYYQRGNTVSALNTVSNREYLSQEYNIEKFNIIAASELKLGNKVKAIAAYDEILKIAPNNTTVFTQKIITMETLKQYSDILRDIEVFKRNLPFEDIRIELMHAEYLVYAGRGNDSMNILNKYKNTDISENSIYKGILGKTLFLKKDYISAKPLLEKEYSRIDSARNAHMLYNTYMRVKAADKAIELVKTYIANHPQNILFQNIYAEYLFNIDRQMAIPEYERLLVLDSENGIALNNLAWIHYELKEYSKAKLYIDKAINIYPDNKNIQDTLFKINTAMKSK